MKKVLTAFLVCLLTLSVFSCGETAKTAEDVSLYELSKSMLSADGFPEMITVSSSDKDAKDNFLFLSDVDYDLTDGYFLSYAKEGSAYELAVIKVADEGSAGEVEDSLARHVAGRVNLYKNYSPSDLPLAKSAEIGTVGKYCYLIMCRDTAAVRTAMLDMIKG